MHHAKHEPAPENSLRRDLSERGCLSRGTPERQRASIAAAAETAALRYSAATGPRWAFRTSEVEPNPFRFSRLFSAFGLLSDFEFLL